MMTQIDFSKKAIDAYSGQPVIVKETMFGAIATSIDPNYFNAYKEHVTSMETGLIRWPGGTLAEVGSVKADGTATTLDLPGRPSAYDLRYPELLHPDLITGPSGESTGRPGISQMLELSRQMGTAFSMTLPAARYAEHPEAAYDDVTYFLNSLFVNRAYNDGLLPERLIFDIGNEQFVPSMYGPAALMMLAAIRDFREQNPTVEFEVGLQAMKNGRETKELIDYIERTADGSAYGHLLAEVDIVRIHSLNRAVTSISDIEDQSSIYWSIRRLQEAILDSREAVGNSDRNIDLYVSAFTSNSDDVVPGLAAGLPGTSAILSLFSGLLELGADYAAAWGIAARSAAETSMSFVDADGTLKKTPQGALFELMSENLVGTQLVLTQQMDGGRLNDFNIFAFTSAERSILYVAANDLGPDGLEIAANLLSGWRIADFSATALNASGGISGEAVLTTREADLVGSQLLVKLKGDYELLQIVISHDGAIVDGQMSIKGNELANSISGTFDDDRIFTFGGDDTIIATSGDDTIDGGAGVDLLDLSAIRSSSTVDMSVGLASSSLGTIEFRSVEKIIGSGGSSTIIGSTGHDTMSGGAGDDDLRGNAGNDRIDGQSGNDRITGGAGSDRLSGGSGNDRIHGGAQNDQLLGGSGNDTIDGGTGDDRIVGGGGNDYLTGGAGADVFVFDQAGGRDIVSDFSGNDGDRLDFTMLSGALRPVDFDSLMKVASETDGDVLLTFGPGFTVSLLDVSLSDLHSGYFIL